MTSKFFPVKVLVSKREQWNQQGAMKTALLSLLEIVIVQAVSVLIL